MAAVTRQPFAPLDGARLHTLTSLKNRQNAISASSPGKRKASDFADTDDSENVDPTLSSKRPKGADSSFSPSMDSFVKPSTILITKSASSSDVSVTSHPKASTPRPRSLLNPKSPASKLSGSITKSTTPLSAPAGRSPTRGKRAGILSRRRTGTSYSRVDPPTFGLSGSSPAPFSLDAALKGTIPSYASRSSSSNVSSSQTQKKSSASSSKAATSADFSSLHEPDMKSSWFFDIHEDTPEQEMTNLLQHSTCVLDISSDEESETRRQRERAEGKENVPPVDDVSQTSRPRAVRCADADAMVIEKERSPLGEMDVKEYYSDGCDENSVVLVPGDDDEEQQQQQNATSNIAPGVHPAEDASAEADADSAAAEEGTKTADELMQKAEEPALCAAVLEPLEGTGDSFEVWESGSAKDEAETPCTAECS